jgi:hypothetical protein
VTGTNNGSGLKWKTLAKKRKSATQGIPPGTEALQWVSNTVTLIYGDRCRSRGHIPVCGTDT